MESIFADELQEQLSDKKIDPDKIKVNLKVDLNITEVLKYFCGLCIHLSHGKDEHAIDRGEGYLVISYHPVIIVTKDLPGVKENLCQVLSRNGYLACPSLEGKRYLINGQPKSVPTSTFINILIEAKIPFIRIMQYGMKMETDTYTDIPDNILK